MSLSKTTSRWLQYPLGSTGESSRPLPLASHQVETAVLTDETEGKSLRQNELTIQSSSEAHHAAATPLATQIKSVSSMESAPTTELLIGYDPGDNLSVREVNWRAVAQGTKAEFSDCFGEPLDKLQFGKLQMWDIIGPLRQQWSDRVAPMLHEVLRSNWTRLLKSQSFEETPKYVLRCYLLGWSKSHAAPHVIFLCSLGQTSFSKTARKIVLEHKLLTSIGWGPSFTCLRLRCGVRQFMQRQRQPSGLEKPKSGSGKYSGESLEEKWRPNGLLVQHLHGIQIFGAADTWPNNVCGLRFATPSQQRATIGGAVEVDGKYYGLSVAHVFGHDVHETYPEITAAQQNESQTPDSLEDEFLVYDQETIDLIEKVSASYGAPPLRQAASCNSNSGSTSVSSGASPPSLRPVSDAHMENPDAMRFRFDVTILPALDCALIDLPPLTSGERLNRVSYLSPNGVVQNHFLNTLAARMPNDGEELLLGSATRRVSAKATLSTAAVKIHNGVDIGNAWILKDANLMEGDCGTWAFNPVDGSVLGVIFAHCPDLDEVYLIPMFRVFETIQNSGLGNNVGLPEYTKFSPTATAMLKLWKIQHKRLPKAVDLDALATVTDLSAKVCESWFLENMSSSRVRLNDSELEAKKRYPSRTISYLDSLQDLETSSSTTEATTLFDSEASVLSRAERESLIMFGKAGQSGGEAEPLDPRYQRVKNEDKERFFMFGRVFELLWTEPANLFRNESQRLRSRHYSLVQYGESAFIEIRRLVVVQRGEHHSLCVPIQTYANRGTLATQATDATHVVFYCTGTNPSLMSGETGLKFLPIEVKLVENALLPPEGRIDFAKIYTIGHNMKVREIGKVLDSDLQRLNRCWRECGFQQNSEPDRRIEQSLKRKRSDLDEAI